MSLVEKIVGEMHIKCTAQTFHDFWAGRPHHVPTISPEKVMGCDLHEGEFGKTGFVIEWSYIHEGKEKKLKELVEVDDEKRMTKFKVVGGDLYEEYRDFHITLEAIPKSGGCLARLTFDYEKKTETSPEPVSFLGYVMGIFREIDIHHQKA